MDLLSLFICSCSLSNIYFCFCSGPFCSLCKKPHRCSSKPIQLAYFPQFLRDTLARMRCWSSTCLSDREFEGECSLTKATVVSSTSWPCNIHSIVCLLCPSEFSSAVSHKNEGSVSCLHARKKSQINCFFCVTDRLQ